MVDVASVFVSLFVSFSVSLGHARAGGSPRWMNPDDQNRTALHCAAATGALG